MKINWIYLLWPLTLMSMTIKADRSNLICHTWIQCAFKPYGDPEKRVIPYSKRIEIAFNRNGTYKRIDLSNNKRDISTGRWNFNDDKTKIGFSVIIWNGVKRPEYPSVIEKNIKILKLTKDSLIISREYYYFKTDKRSKIYMHDDIYFVKKR